MRVMVFALAMVLVCGGTALPDAAAPEKPSPVVAASAPLKIGYVDLTRVLRAYARTHDFQQDLKKAQAALAGREKQLIDQSAKSKAEMDQLAMGTPQRRELEKRNAEILAELKAFRKKNFDVLNKKFVATVNLLYDDVLREVDKFGRENDYDFIIKDQSVEAPATTHDAVVLQITKRVVLYSKPEYDLSSVISRRLNEKYKAEKAQDPEATNVETPVEEPVKER